MIFGKMTYQKKVMLLPWITVLVMIIIYALALNDTFKIRRECRNLERESLIVENAPLQMTELRNKLEEINKITGDLATNSGIDPLMELVSGLSNTYHVTLADYQPIHIFNYQSYVIQTRIVDFEGPFIQCLKVLYNLEQKYHFGKVVSVNYIAKTNSKTSRKQLNMQVVIQSIHNENNYLSNNKKVE